MCHVHTAADATRFMDNTKRLDVMMRRTILARLSQNFTHSAASPRHVTPLTTHILRPKLRVTSFSREPLLKRSFSLYPPRNASYKRFSNHGEPGQSDPGPDSSGPGLFRSFNSLDGGTKVVIGLVILSGFYYVAHLEQVPETGRWRFMAVSPKFEASLWDASYNEVMSEFRGRVLPPNHPLTRYIHGIVARLLEANHLGSLKDVPTSSRTLPQEALFGSGPGMDDLWDPDAVPKDGTNHMSNTVGPNKQWNLVVVKDDKMINAMAMPGTVIVFTGILPVCRDEQGLAAVLGHEIAHVSARHTAERYSYSKVLIVIALLLDSLGFGGAMAGLVQSFLMELPNSRAQELEADKIGLRLMSKACYDPDAAPSMFSRLAKVEGAGSHKYLDFLTTHPASEKRVKALQAQLPDAYSLQAATSECAGVADKLSAFRDSFRSAW